MGGVPVQLAVFRGWINRMHLITSIVACSVPCTAMGRAGLHLLTADVTVQNHTVFSTRGYIPKTTDPPLEANGAPA